MAFAFFLLWMLASLGLLTVWVFRSTMPAMLAAERDTAEAAKTDARSDASANHRAPRTRGGARSHIARILILTGTILALCLVGARYATA